MALTSRKKITLLPFLLGAIIALGVPAANAATLEDYLIVGRYVNDTSVDASNYELGQISVLDLPTPVNSPGEAPSTGTFNDAKIAIMETSGTVAMSDIAMFGTGPTGIECAGSYNACTDSGGNLSGTTYNGGAIGNGTGVLGNQDLSGITADIAVIQDWIAGSSITGSIDTDDGKITGDLVVNLSAGVSVFDFTDNGGSLTYQKDILVENGSLIFQGGADAYAVVLVNEGSNFLTSNGNLVIGDDGIGLNNVVIISQNQGTDGNFGISNTYLNGVSLWDVGADVQNNMSLDNVTGCTQLVGDDVDIQDVRLNRCAFNTSVVPIPAAVWLFGSGLGLLGFIRRRKFLRA